MISQRATQARRDGLGAARLACNPRLVRKEPVGEFVQHDHATAFARCPPTPHRFRRKTAGPSSCIVRALAAEPATPRLDDVPEDKRSAVEVNRHGRRADHAGRRWRRGEDCCFGLAGIAALAGGVALGWSHGDGLRYFLHSLSAATTATC